MAALEAMVLAAGKSVAKLVAGRWLAGRAARAEAADDLIEMIRIGFPDQLLRRKTERQFEALADEVYERLLPLVRQEFRGLDDGTREAALHQVALTLDRADLSDQALLGDDLDPVKLARRLRKTLPAREAGFQLGEAGARLYQLLLDECCDCLAHILVHLPQFTERAAAESLARLTHTVGLLETILSRLPARTLDAPEGDSLDDQFTRRYLTSISDSLDRLELFGVRFERFTRPQTTLSVAYISLNVADENKAAESKAYDNGPFRIDEWRSGRREPGTVRVERALSERPRMLIRGEAGGGKSTLLRWLAITAARGAFTGELAGLNGCVPFLINLRSHADQPLPKPEDFLDDVAPALSGLMPKGWAHRRLMSARAVLLVDGIDEITQSQRPNVRSWLGQLTSQFPGVRMVVTSRPAAAEADWLRAEGFGTAFLEPLGPDDLRSLIEHWHLAVRDSDGLPCPPERLPSYEARLLARMESSPHLRALASTPLLAAMLCTLNLDRETLPRDRMGLYAAALDMLTDVRDAKRGVPSARTVRLEREQKIRVLQSLAWHLSATDRVELPLATVRRLVAERLAAMPQVSAAAEDVVGLLLERSGVIRQPVPGTVDFVHRTVQEYLAAKQAAELGDMDLLVRNAHLDQWRETIVMAAGHANEPARRELITGLLGRAEAEPEHADRLKLLTAGFLETAPSVPDDLQATLTRNLDEFIPPPDPDTARLLAAVGEPVLRRLPENLDDLAYDEISGIIDIARLINGPEALDLLAKYTKHHTEDDHSFVHQQLSQASRYFDPHEYTEHVLKSTPANGIIHISSSETQLSALYEVPPLSQLRIEFPHPMNLGFLPRHAATLKSLALYFATGGIDIVTLPEMPILQHLLLYSPGLTELGFLDRLPPLRSAWLTSCEDIRDYGPLRRSTALQELNLRGCRHLHTLRQLPPLATVKDLGLTGSRLDDGQLDRLAEAAPNVRTLRLGDCEWLNDLDPLRALELETLIIGDNGAVRDLRPLSEQVDLLTLHLSNTGITDLTHLEGLTKLLLLNLDGCSAVTDLSPIAMLPRLSVLRAENIAPGVDLSPLARNPSLEAVCISRGQDVRGGEKLGDRLKIS